MDSIRSNNNKLRASNQNLSPLMISGQARGALAPYSPPENLIKYLILNSPGSGSGSSRKSGYRSPLSPLTEDSPIKVMEGVLVMDGILVKSDSDSPAGGSLSGSSSSSRSGGFNKAGSGLCRHWEEIGHCRSGSKCQFAHGKENLPTDRFAMRNKYEISKSPAMGRCSYGSKSPLPYSSITAEVAMVSQKDSPSPLGKTSQTPNSISNPEHTNKTPLRRTPNITINPTTIKTPFTVKQKASPSTTVKKLWSPLDDGIEVSLPSQPEKSPSNEDLNAYIADVLYGDPKSKRLPVFSEFCPDNDDTCQGP